MQKLYIFFVFAIVLRVSCGRVLSDDLKRDVRELLYSIGALLEFVERFYFEMNTDAVLGLVLGQVQLEEILYENHPAEFSTSVWLLVDKTVYLRRKINPLLPSSPRKFVFFKNTLLVPEFWHRTVPFTRGRLLDLGMYKNWTVRTILENKAAEYDGIPTDVCLEEILRESSGVSRYKRCGVSPVCRTVMLENRNDTGYLLTHRLLYLQIARQAKCLMGEFTFQEYMTKYCSLMWKEAKTNEYLEFHQRDIFLEQVVLCGMEGFSEFLAPRWRRLVVEWQEMQGCYRRDDLTEEINKRNTNIVEFGCADHTTGLGFAALALNLRYLLSNFNHT